MLHRFGGERLLVLLPADKEEKPIFVQLSSDSSTHSFLTRFLCRLPRTSQYRRGKVFVLAVPRPCAYRFASRTHITIERGVPRCGSKDDAQHVVAS